MNAMRILPKSSLVALLGLLLLTIGCSREEGPLSVKKGEVAPDFRLPSAQGREVALEDFRGKRAVLLYFSMGPG